MRAAPAFWLVAQRQPRGGDGEESAEMHRESDGAGGEGEGEREHEKM